MVLKRKKKKEKRKEKNRKLNREILYKNKTITILGLLVIGLLVCLFVFFILTISNVIDNTFYERISVFFSALVSLLSSIIALSLPLIMKNLSLKEKQEDQEEKKEAKNKAENKKVQDFFDNLMMLIEKIYISKYKKPYSMNLALLVRKSNELNEYFGIFSIPYHEEGRDIDDYGIYFKNGKYYMIPNSAVLRKSELDKEKYIDLIIKPNQKNIREILDNFYEDLVNYANEIFSLELTIKTDFRLVFND